MYINYSIKGKSSSAKMLIIAKNSKNLSMKKARGHNNIKPIYIVYIHL